MLKALISFITIVVLTLFSTACSVSPTTPTSAPKPTMVAPAATAIPSTQAATAVPPPTTAPTVPVATKPPAIPKTLVFGIWSAPRTFNPWITNDSPSWVVDDMVYSGLMRLNAEGKPVGDLAERWEISPDGKVYTFYLRKNAKWHDGRPVTAEDGVFTLSRLLTSVFSGRFKTIQGSDDYTAGKATKVAGLEAVDANTLRVTLQAPTAPLLSHLSIQGAILPNHLLGQVPPDQLEKHPFFQKPIGSGPFKFIQYQSGQFVELAAFEDYHFGKPDFDKLFIRIGTADVLQAQLQKGELDVTAIAPAEADRAKALSGVKLYVFPTSIVQAININLSRPYLQDIRVRQAMAHALDKKKMVTTLLGTLGQTMDTPIASPEWAITTKVTTYPYNVEKAKSLLKEANWDGSRRIVLRYPTGNKPREDSAALIQEAFKIVGIEVELKVSDFATLTNDAVSGNFDMLLLGNQSLHDPDYIATQYLSNAIPPAGVNYMRYKNPKVDQLLEQGRATTKIEDRALLYAEFQAILTQDLPKIFMYVDPDLYGARDRIDGIKPLITAGQWRSLYWNIAEWKLKN